VGSKHGDPNPEPLTLSTTADARNEIGKNIGDTDAIRMLVYV